MCLTAASETGKFPVLARARIVLMVSLWDLGRACVNRVFRDFLMALNPFRKKASGMGFGHGWPGAATLNAGQTPWVGALLSPSSERLLEFWQHATPDATA